MFVLCWVGCVLRNFFVTGLNLLDIIHSLRNEDDEDLIIQCDVFDDEKTADDEALSAEMNLDVDVTNHRALFDAVFQKVRRARCCHANHAAFCTCRDVKVETGVWCHQKIKIGIVLAGCLQFCREQMAFGGTRDRN